VQALADTQTELREPLKLVPQLFEAAFEYEHARVRADAFERRASGDTLIEVKSTMSAKEGPAPGSIFLETIVVTSFVGKGFDLAKQLLVDRVNECFQWMEEGRLHSLFRPEAN